jgi:hypothetical protein
MPDRQLWKFGAGFRAIDLLLKLLVIPVAFQIFYGSFVALFTLLAGYVGPGVPRWIDGLMLGFGFVSTAWGTLCMFRVIWPRRDAGHQAGQSEGAA